MSEKTDWFKKAFSVVKEQRKSSLVKNFFSLSILHGLNIVLPFITLPYVLRVVGAEHYGIIVMANALLLYFDKFSEYSFNISATRDVAVNRDNHAELSNIYSRVLSTKFILLFFSGLVFFSVVFLVPKFSAYWGIYAICFVQLIGTALFPEWFFQGIEQMKYITIINASIKIFFTICVFFFITSKEDYYYLPLLNMLGFLLAGIYGQLVLMIKYKLRFSFPGFAVVGNTLRANFNIFINQFVPNLYNNSTTFILGLLTNNSTVGIYGISKNIVEYGIEVISIMSRVFFPHLNRNFQSFDKFVKLILSIGLLIAIGFCASSYLIVWILKLPMIGVPIICILAPSVFMFAMYCCYGTNYFIVKRQDKLVMKNTMLASFTGFLLSFPLILSLGAIGAAINLTLARGILGMGLWRKYKIATKTVIE
ncbi:oligosaccharide flippase family protein [Chitinophaga rhizophila]|uniref:Oligosaccharide flippase family protein n=1 Tax=Chitinophaga rhizophila TaxID=2866212 RepID=A0ABS7GFG7_9BACT|nr:oligosaccharide flippase family protein [Chitinophaga rhizophila]MBW8686440.1 oligosaccharide flippase family protein [Chitinophaga rhizophila]